MAEQRARQQFLQAFLSRGIMEGREVKQQFREACEAHKYAVAKEREMVAMVEMITNINAPLRDMHLQINKACSEDTGSHHYVLVNTVESDITKMSPYNTVPENEFLKRLIEGIVDSNIGEVSSNEALNYVSLLPDGVRISKSEAEKLINRMIQDKWLLEIDGKISLATRAIIELETYIREQYSDSYVDCNMCKKLCLKGRTCEECGTKLHKHCARTFFKNQKNQRRCPGRNCDAQWVSSEQAE